MGRFHGNDSLIGPEQGVDDCRVGLSPTDEEKDVGLGAFACLANPAARTLAPFVRPVGLACHAVGFQQSAQDFGVCSVIVITLK